MSSLLVKRVFEEQAEKIADAAITVDNTNRLFLFIFIDF
jgi:hypothetical protein